MKPKTSKVKRVKAWAFMQDTWGGKDFISSPYEYRVTEIYLEKPNVAYNPFTHKKTWKPTEIEIYIPTTHKKK